MCSELRKGANCGSQSHHSAHDGRGFPRCKYLWNFSKGWCSDREFIAMNFATAMNRHGKSALSFLSLLSTPKIKILLHRTCPASSSKADEFTFGISVDSSNAGEVEQRCGAWQKGHVLQRPPWCSRSADFKLIFPSAIIGNSPTKQRWNIQGYGLISQS